MNTLGRKTILLNLKRINQVFKTSRYVPVQAYDRTGIVIRFQWDIRVLPKNVSDDDLMKILNKSHREDRPFTEICELDTIPAVCIYEDPFLGLRALHIKSKS